VRCAYRPGLPAVSAIQRSAGIRQIAKRLSPTCLLIAQWSRAFQIEAKTISKIYLFKVKYNGMIYSMRPFRNLERGRVRGFGQAHAPDLPRMAVSSRRTYENRISVGSSLLKALNYLLAVFFASIATEAPQPLNSVCCRGTSF
jgi:hypothetical protein